jgi:DNA-directed RNA polymerase subunit RPC12/RpoP
VPLTPELAVAAGGPNEYGVLTYHGTVGQAETRLNYRTENDIMDETKLVQCPECGGTGKVPLHLDNLPGPSLEIDCPTCGGTGLVRAISDPLT